MVQPFLRVLLVYIVVVVKLPFSDLLLERMYYPRSNPLEVRHLPFDLIRPMLAKPMVPSFRHLLQYSQKSLAEA